MSSENVTRLQGWYEAFGRGDMPTVLAAMDPNWHGSHVSRGVRRRPPGVY